ncbi:MAG: glycosyltransferase family 61 protein [Planctomycetota bacterium]
MSYPLPSHGEPSVIDWFRQFDRRSFDDEVLCRFAGGRVVGPGVILSPDGDTIALDVSVSFGEEVAHWMQRSRGIPAPRPLHGDIASVATISGHTYFHWLLEELPRFLAAASRGHDTIIAHRRLIGTVPAAIGYRGLLVDAAAGRHHVCEQLSVESFYGSTGHPTPEVVRILQDFAPRIDTGEGTWGERLFVSRAHAAIRRLFNEEAIWSRLEPRGFRRLVLERMPWGEQIAAFSRARVIVAPHGAGLANLVFCQPGTRVVEAFHPGFMHWVFWRIASLTGLDYRPVVGDGGGPLRHDLTHNRSDIVIDPGQIDSALAD